MILYCVDSSRNQVESLLEFMNNIIDSGIIKISLHINNQMIFVVNRNHWNQIRNKESSQDSNTTLNHVNEINSGRPLKI